MKLGIARKQAAGSRERAVMPDAGEDVQHFAPFWLRMAHAIRREQRKA